MRRKSWQRKKKNVDVKKALPYFTFCNSKLAYILFHFFFFLYIDRTLYLIRQINQRKKRKEHLDFGNLPSVSDLTSSYIWENKCCT